MNIPKQVIIAGIRYNVISKSVVDEKNHDVDGEIDYSKQTISLKDSMDGDYKEMVFLHEIMHGIFEDRELDQDERIVSTLAKGLYQVIKDNPEIFSNTL